MRRVLSQIPVAKQKDIAKTLILLAALVCSMASLSMLGFTKATETTGLLWWQETKEIPLSERMSYLYAAIGLYASGAVLAVVGVALSMMQGSLRKYAPILTGVDFISIQSIADIVNKSSRKVYRDVQAMIDSGMVSDVYIDHKAGLVVSKTYIPKNSHKAVATCSGCGGNTEVFVGIPKPCSFCGQPLIVNEH